MTADDVVKCVCDEFGISVLQLKSGKHNPPLPDARKIIAFYLYNILELNLRQTAEILNIKSRSGVLCQIKMYLLLASNDKKFKHKISNIEKRLYENQNK